MQAPIARNPKGPEVNLGSQYIATARILRRLGEGSGGTVYEALQTRPRRRVALKVLKRAAVPERFTHEAQILAGLHHPGIARLFEAGSVGEGDQSRPFFAMELVEGLPLTEYTRSKGLSVEERLALFAAVCDAVEHAHAAGIVHRDLKPANILVDVSGRPVVLDFGIARAPALGPDATMHTEVGQLLGSIPYLSPEQVAGRSRDADARSDVFALGVILYELLTGCRPHWAQAGSIYEVMRAIQLEEAAPLRAADKRLHADLDRMVSKALSKDAPRRYPSAGALGAEVRRFLEHLPITARPPSRAYKAARFCRRHRALVTATGLVIAALAVGVGVATWQAVEATLARKHADARRDQLLRVANDALEAYRRLGMIVQSATEKRRLIDLRITALECLIADAPEDVLLTRDLADGYHQKGRLQGGLDSSNEGDFAGAEISVQHAIDLNRRVLARAQGDRVALAALASAYRSLGGILENLGRLPAAAEALATALEVQGALCDSAPNDLDAWSMLATYTRNFAAHSARGGFASDAIEPVRKVVRKFDRYPPHSPTTSAEAYASGTVREPLAQAFLHLQLPDEGANQLELGRAYLQRAAAAEPSNLDYALGPVNLVRIGAWAISEKGEHARAAEQFASAAEEYRRILRSAPDRWAVWEVVAMCYEGSAGDWKAAGDLGRAAGALREALRVREQLLAQAPDEQRAREFAMGARIDLAGALMEWGADQSRDDAARLDSWGEARELLGRAVDELTKLRNEGRLPETDAHWLAELPKEVEQCESASRLLAAPE